MTKFRVHLGYGEIVRIWGFIDGSWLIGPDGFREVRLNLEERYLEWVD